MSTTETVRAWSTTAASNTSADAAIASSDSQSPDTLDNNVRSIMAAVKKQANDIGGALAAGGSANALTVTTNQVLESGQLTGGLALIVKAASTNTSATVTFAPDGLTAAAIKRADGSALAVGSITAGMFLILVYNSGTSEWWAANIAPIGSARASFSATKSGNQTGIASNTNTQITFDTIAYNVGSYFTSNAWTPPAGTCLVSAGLDVVGAATTNVHQIAIYKNGAAYKVCAVAAASNNIAIPSLTIQDQCNGIDVYTVFFFGPASGASLTVPSGVGTYFMGTMI